MTSRCHLALVVAALSLASGRVTSACACSQYLSFEEALRAAASALGGRVTSQGFRDPEHLYPAVDNVVYLDVTVLQVVKGREERRTVRVWNPWAGTSCDDDGFRALTPGTLVAFAATRNKPAHRETWDALGIQPGPDDYVVGTCGAHWKTVSSERDLKSLGVRNRPPNKEMQRTKPAQARELRR